jgi:hypothetical protein
VMTAREFLGDATYLAWLADYEDLRELRNKVSGARPTEEEKVQLRLNKPWERFYAAVLFDKRAMN